MAGEKQRELVGFNDYLFFWGRWLILLPAALVAGIIVSFPVHWGVMLIKALTQPDSFPWGLFSARTLEALGIALFAPKAFIATGTWVAPRAKVHIGILLLVLWLILLAAVIGYVSLSGKYEVNWVQTVASAVFGVAGAYWGAYAAHGKYAQYTSTTPVTTDVHGDRDGDSLRARLLALKAEADRTRGEAYGNSSPLRRLLEVLKLETTLGCSNQAVIGGLDDFFRTVSEDALVKELFDICWGMGRPGNNYAGLTPNLRSWWIGEIFAATDAADEIKSLHAPLANHEYTEEERRWEKTVLDRVLGIDA